MPEGIRLGLEHHVAHRLADAAAEYQKVLNHEPNNAEAMLLLGLVARQSGQAHAAVEVLKAAVAFRDHVSRFHLNLGHAYRDVEDLSAAIACYRRAIELSDDSSEAHRSLGDILTQQGKWQEAHASYRRARELSPESHQTYANEGYLFFREGLLEEAARCYQQGLTKAPGNADSLNHLGLILKKQGKLKDAVHCFRQAIDHAPQESVIHFNLGNALYEREDLKEAIACYRQAILLDRRNAKAFNNLGNVLEKIGKLEEALQCYRQASVIDPDDIAILCNLGSALLSCNDLDGAEACYRKALSLQPEAAEIHNGYGNLLVRKQRFEEAGDRFRSAIALRPDYSEAYVNLGTALLWQVRIGEARACYRRAIELDPNCAGAHYNHALACLRSGDFDVGWKEYEWRFDFRELGTPRAHFQEKLWQGEPLNGASILLHAEQGLGDTIQFARYARLVTERGGQVILRVPRTLHRLMQGLTGEVKVVAEGEPLPQFSYQCPLMSLPRTFNTKIDTIPFETPYLRLDPTVIEEQFKMWPSKGIRVGLAWAGNPKLRYDKRRSIALKELAPLVSISGISFFSLQKGVAVGQLAQLDHPVQIPDACASHQEFAETAALVATLDLVITVDTSIAHLAGAMGKPVWVMLAYSPDWRWLLQRDDSPWYPTAKLFRQPAAGDWKSVVQRICQELTSFVDLHRSRTLA